MRFAIIAGACAVGLSCATVVTWAAAPSLEKAWETPAELKNPESVVFDAGRGLMYVSNVNGQPTDKTGTGFVSTLDKDGKIVTLEWAKGLNAPKGLAISGKHLYAAEVDSLAEIDLDTGAVLQHYPAPGAQFLNDVAVDDAGNVYVSDMFTDTIWRLSQGQFTAWLASPKLKSPNGVHVDGDRLVVGAWGVRTDGFNTPVPGNLVTVSIADKSIADLGNGTPIGNLDGVEPYEGAWLITDWMAGKLLYVTDAGEAQTLLTLSQGAADHTLIPSESLVVIPMMNDNKVVAYRMAKP